MIVPDKNVLMFQLVGPCGFCIEYHKTRVERAEQDNFRGCVGDCR